MDAFRSMINSIEHRILSIESLFKPHKYLKMSENADQLIFTRQRGLITVLQKVSSINSGARLLAHRQDKTSKRCNETIQVRRVTWKLLITRISLIVMLFYDVCSPVCFSKLQWSKGYVQLLLSQIVHVLDRVVSFQKFAQTCNYSVIHLQIVCFYL